MSYSGKTDERVISAARVHLAAGTVPARGAASAPVPPARRPGSRTGPAGCRAHRTLAPSPWSARSLPRLPGSQPSRAPRLPRASQRPPPPPSQTLTPPRGTPAIGFPASPGPRVPASREARQPARHPAAFMRAYTDSRGHEPAGFIGNHPRLHTVPRPLLIRLRQINRHSGTMRLRVRRLATGPDFENSGANPRI